MLPTCPHCAEYAPPRDTECSSCGTALFPSLPKARGSVAATPRVSESDVLQLLAQHGFVEVSE